MSTSDFRKTPQRVGKLRYAQRGRAALRQPVSHLDLNGESVLWSHHADVRRPVAQRATLTAALTLWSDQVLRVGTSLGDVL